MAEWTEEQIKALVEAAEQGTFRKKLRVYEEIFIDLASGSGTVTKNFSKVKSGWIRAITHKVAVNATRSSTFIKLCHNSGGLSALDKVVVAALTGETVNWDGLYLLGEGNYDQVLWLGCSNGDDLYAVVSGYEIIL